MPPTAVRNRHYPWSFRLPRRRADDEQIDLDRYTDGARLCGAARPPDPRSSVPDPPYSGAMPVAQETLSRSTETSLSDDEVLALRADFPILANEGLVYLDSGATSQKPLAGLAA